MIRLLLTFLALMTGLGAQVSPANAAVRVPQSAVGMVAPSARAEARSTAPTGVMLAAYPQAIARIVEPLKVIDAPVPTVRTRIDRARE